MSDYITFAKLAAGITLVFALLFVAHQALELVKDIGRAEVQAKWDKDKLAHLEALQILTERQRQTEQGFNQQLQKAQNDFTEKQTQITADADRARNAADSLRNDLTTVRAKLSAASADTSTAVIEYASTSTDVLEQCTTRYRDMAEKADRHAADAAMMQAAWPRANDN